MHAHMAIISTNLVCSVEMPLTSRERTLRQLRIQLPFYLIVWINTENAKSALRGSLCQP